MIDKMILYNPAIGTMNMGDHIIFDAIRTQIDDMFPDTKYYELPTQMPVSERVLDWYSDIDLRFVCGTNLLKNNMRCEWGRYLPHFNGIRQWDIELKNRKKYGPVVLMGCGWQKYQQGKDKYSERLWNELLNKQYVHSVRDNYALVKLNELGISNVVNTGCPTLWSLTPEHCREIPTHKAESVVTTITDYRQDASSDQKMLNVLSEKYRHVYIWLQGYEDGDYLKRLSLKDNMTAINGGLTAFDRLLDRDDIEFVGTRLHGGIRALQHKRRAIFIAVDNRTKEMGKEIGLHYLERSNMNDLIDLVEDEQEYNIALPLKEITMFKEQFK